MAHDHGRLDPGLPPPGGQAQRQGVAGRLGHVGAGQGLLGGGAGLKMAARGNWSSGPRTSASSSITALKAASVPYNCSAAPASRLPWPGTTKPTGGAPPGRPAPVEPGRRPARRRLPQRPGQPGGGAGDDGDTFGQVGPAHPGLVGHGAKGHVGVGLGELGQPAGCGPGRGRVAGRHLHQRHRSPRGGAQSRPAPAPPPLGAPTQ